MTRTAILQVADTGPLESLVHMLREAGYGCMVPGPELRRVLSRELGLDCVLDIGQLVSSMGYEHPFSIPKATVEDMDGDVIYVDVKAHRNGKLVWPRWPHLRDRTLWYRINGGKPEHVIKACTGCGGNGHDDHGGDKRTKCARCGGTGKGFDCGDEVNPPCPVITPNQWYRDHPKAYCMWPPFFRFHEYQYGRPKDGGHKGLYMPPICLIHNVNGWGYGSLVGPVQELGVKVHGRGSHDGLLNHREVPVRLSSALAMVHLKSNDAPGYAIYEALAAGCPVVCSKRLIWRSAMQELLIDGGTCLTYDRETHDPLTPEDVLRCRDEIAEHLRRLGDPEHNLRIGEAGRQRLSEVMWSAKESSDVNSLRCFMEKWFNA